MNTRRWLTRIWDFVRLTRLERPIGIWLLLWPTLWALWIAGGGRPSLRLVVVFVFGTVFMRSAGCIVNDLADRDIDVHVRRTRERPLAARVISPMEALGLFAVLIAASLALVTQLNWLTVELSCVGAALTLTYPFFKRFFPLPQLYLGLAFGWAVPMAFAASLGAVPRIAWLMLVAAVLWAGVYDTIYAISDREDDQRIGIHSTAILFGGLDRPLIGAMQLLMLWALVLIGQSEEMRWVYYAALGVAALLFLWQQWLIRDHDPERCQRAFRNNNYVGMSVFIGILLSYGTA